MMSKPVNKRIIQNIRSYMKEVGVHPVSELDSAIIEAFGSREGDIIIEEMLRCFDMQEAWMLTGDYSDPHEFRDTEMVDVINRYRQLSLLASGFYDTFVFSAVMERICRYPDCFEGAISDLGCGNGVISSFVARSFPGCTVTGLDISANAVRTAREIAQRLDLSNIRFLQQDSLSEETDTLLSVRTLHENLPGYAYEPGATSSSAALELSLSLMNQAISEYLPTLTRHIRPGGHMFLFERIPSEPVWKLICESLLSNGFTLRNGTGETLSCKTGDEIGTFKFGIFDRISQ